MSQQDKCLILALNAHGLALAEKLRSHLDRNKLGSAEIGEGDDFAGQLVAAFQTGRPILAICATGIVVRILAKVITDKTKEPPVVVIAADGSAVIPLLGGHHGGNDLARTAAACLGVAPAISTASDLAFGVDLENPPAGWSLANPQDIKAFVSAMLAGATLCLPEAAGWLADSALPVSADGALSIIVSNGEAIGNSGTLLYRPKNLAVGIGCERGTATAEILQLLGETLAGAKLDIASVAGLYSLDLKSDEAALHEVAGTLKLPVRFFDAGTLASESHRLANPSEVVLAEVGVPGVAEAAALAAVGPAGRLLAEKRKSRRTTCAIAEAPEVFDGSRIGAARGEFYIVGIGPGQAAWRTHEAEQLITSADIIVGYQLYLDLIVDLTSGKDLRPYALGAEEERVRQALSLAAAGNRVALVSSGDAGIFAMGALAQELLAQADCPAAWGRIKLINAPGISAMQAAAARIGAPLGHDFCAISLSDLLTPREVILRRIDGAAAADFVIAFYNPVSRRRRDLLQIAQQKLLAQRPADTPVVIARNLGRADERLRVVDLIDLQTDDVDMLSIVLVGSSMTQTRTQADGLRVFTPRGYPLIKKDRAV